MSKFNPNLILTVIVFAVILIAGMVLIPKVFPTLSLAICALLAVLIAVVIAVILGHFFGVKR